MTTPADPDSSAPSLPPREGDGASPENPASTSAPHTAGADWPFIVGLSVLGGSYVVLILLLLVADTVYTTPGHLLEALAKPEIRYAIKLTLITCSLAAIASVWVATPLGYLLSRFRFPGRGIVDLLLDIPIVLPPLVIGISLLILFHLPLGGTKLAPRSLESWLNKTFDWQVTFAVPSVVLAQFAVACAFAVRTMKVTFDQISPRTEWVAMTLGCSRGQAFWRVVLPQAGRGLLTALTIAWARSLGEFGPILVFSGSTRFRTEVLSTTVFLELSVGNLNAAVAVSLLMVAVAIVVLGIVRTFGSPASSGIG